MAVVGSETVSIAVIGLGYVGLPLAAEFGQRHDVVGYDLSRTRIDQLRRRHDVNLEVDEDALRRAERLTFTDDLAAIAHCTVFVVTVPTPIDEHRRPDLGPLLAASKAIGSVLKPGDLVIYESTVYPGCTEGDCVPVLERESGLAFNRDFFCGYSPERINPGDRTRRLPDIVKVTSGSTPEAADRVDRLYAGIVTAGTHRAPSIMVAEAAKVIENTQRDLNIALVNELAIIFQRLGLDTEDVLEAAGSKWNFLPFRPGLVGGHCIGVDPYYLTHKAQSVGHHPEIILAGRRLNDDMGRYVGGQLVKAMLARRIPVNGARVLVLGLAFKENCPDIRNTGVLNVLRELAEFECAVDVHDPWVDAAEARGEHGIETVETPEEGAYDAIVLAVGHDVFREAGASALRRYGAPTHVFYDLKYVFGAAETDLRL